MDAEGQKKNFIRIGYMLPAWIAILVMSCAVAAAQQSAPAPAVQTETADATAAKPQAAQPATEETPEQRRQDAQMQERKNQLAVDTAKLLELANELKAEMDKSSKDTLSLGVIKKADEVEKLARKVRAEMKASIGN
jgi:sRNA-binding protein